MAVAVIGKVGIPSTGLTTPIKWMLSVAILIDRPMSIPQLLCNWRLQCSQILKSMHFFVLSSNTIIPLKDLLNILFFGDYTYETLYLHVRSLDFTIVVVSGRVGIPLTGLTTPVK